MISINNPEQLKNLAGFFNTVAAAWFTAATVSPLFTNERGTVPALLLAIAGILFSVGFLFLSNHLLKDL